MDSIRPTSLGRDAQCAVPMMRVSGCETVEVILTSLGSSIVCVYQEMTLTSRAAGLSG